MQKLFSTAALIALLICGQKVFLTPRPATTGGAHRAPSCAVENTKTADESTRRLRRTGFEYIRSANLRRPASAPRMC